MSKGYSGSEACYAAGGPVLAKTNSRFLKTEDQFRTDKGVDQDYGTKSKHAPDDKCLPAVKPRK